MIKIINLDDTYGIDLFDTLSLTLSIETSDECKNFILAIGIVRIYLSTSFTIMKKERKEIFYDATSTDAEA